MSKKRKLESVNLYRDVLSTVLSFLSSWEDRLAFRSTCREWKAASEVTDWDAFRRSCGILELSKVEPWNVACNGTVHPFEDGFAVVSEDRFTRIGSDGGKMWTRTSELALNARAISLDGELYLFQRKIIDCVASKFRSDGSTKLIEGWSLEGGWLSNPVCVMEPDTIFLRTGSSMNAFNPKTLHTIDVGERKDCNYHQISFGRRITIASFMLLDAGNVIFQLMKTEAYKRRLFLGSRSEDHESSGIFESVSDIVCAHGRFVVFTKTGRAIFFEDSKEAFSGPSGWIALGTGNVLAAKISDGFVACVGDDRILRTIDVAKMTFRRRSIPISEKKIVRFVRNGRTLLCVDEDGNVFAFD